ncbi:MAG: hypothetical protein KBD00_00810 [Candidatus Peribacteraceae bacterium]|nr:hypothetical protein [Candidatus Peribacteraceae bacterium]
MSPTSSGGFGKILVIALVLGLGTFAFVNYKQRMDYAKELQKAKVQADQLQAGGDNPQNVEMAKGIVDKVRKLYSIPGDIDPTVAQIVDVDKLKEKNSFYNFAKNGDYLIVTPTRALLYDPTKNIILDVVPVQLQAPAATPASTNSSAMPAMKSSAKSAVRS